MAGSVARRDLHGNDEPPTGCSNPNISGVRHPWGTSRGALEAIRAAVSCELAGIGAVDDVVVTGGRVRRGSWAPLILVHATQREPVARCGDLIH
jgi:hypothetical protein